MGSAYVGSHFYALTPFSRPRGEKNVGRSNTPNSQFMRRKEQINWRMRLFI